MSIDWPTLRLTAELASLTTLILLVVATPIAWWLAQTRSPMREWIATIVALPLVLPPTVLGFYLLLLLGPRGVVGQLTSALGLGTLPFTFAGLVVASVVYSIPFVVQPVRNAFESMGTQPMEAAAMLGASPLRAFATVALPLARRGFVTGGVLGFAHTVGEFGVVLMVGGNIPGRTRVASIAIYDHVEALEWGQAHWLAGVLLVFSFALVASMFHAERRLQANRLDH